MAKLVELKEAARLLGVTPDELNDMRTRSEIFGYRDGATWKFKMEEIERVAAQRGGQLDASPPPGDEGESILVSDEALGGSDDTTASTIIGKSGDKRTAADSDIRLADEKRSGESPTGSDSGVSLVPDAGESDVRLVPTDSDILASGQGGKGRTEDASDLGGDALSLDSGLSLGGSDLSLGEDIDLGGDDAGHLKLDADEEDDFVFGSGLGSDVTKSGDSGISLGSPTDSGISLEEAPVGLDGSAVEALELGEDDMIELEEAADPEAATQLKADDDFLLTPVEDMTGDESDSGSQVIALDTEEFDDSSDGMLGAMGTQLLEDEAALIGAGGEPLGVAPGLAAQPAAAYTVPEAPWSVWNVLTLLVIVLLMCFTGMMMVDLLRNMWSWDSTYPINSALMDGLLEALGMTGS